MSLFIFSALLATAIKAGEVRVTNPHREGLRDKAVLCIAFSRMSTELDMADEASVKKQLAGSNKKANDLMNELLEKFYRKCFHQFDEKSVQKYVTRKERILVSELEGILNKVKSEPDLPLTPEEVEVLDEVRADEANGKRRFMPNVVDDEIVRLEEMEKSPSAQRGYDLPFGILDAGPAFYVSLISLVLLFSSIGAGLGLKTLMKSEAEAKIKPKYVRTRQQKKKA